MLLPQVIYEKEQSITLRTRFETLNLLHVIRCEMFTFCDVLHETKQKSKQTLESAQCVTEITFNF